MNADIIELEMNNNQMPKVPLKLRKYQANKKDSSQIINQSVKHNSKDSKIKPVS